MMEFLESTDYVNDTQLSFRKGLGCEYSVLDLVESIRLLILCGRVDLVVAEDYTVAFNCLYGSAIIGREFAC